MKYLATALLILATPAVAGNVARIEQAGDRHVAVVEQAGFGNVHHSVQDGAFNVLNVGTIGINNSTTTLQRSLNGHSIDIRQGTDLSGNLLTTQGAINSDVSVIQFGPEGNHAQIVQGGLLNIGSGFNNRASVEQVGSFNQAQVHQFGSNGTARVEQFNDDNVAIVLMTGGGSATGSSNNTNVLSRQIGNQNWAEFRQQGFDLDARVLQVGDQNVSLINQFENGHRADVFQIQSFNRSTIDQSGFNHVATVSQGTAPGFGGHTSAIVQTGVGNVATINQR